MVKERLLEKHDVKHKDSTPFYFLPRTDAPRIQSWKHEWDCANIYVTLQDQIRHWTYEQNKEYIELGFMPDRSSVLEIDGKPLVVFWEIDEGTMKHEKVSQKIPGYIKLLRQRQDYPVVVIFTAPTIERLKNILHDSVLPHGYVKQFAGCVYSRLINEPLSNIFLRPKELDSPIYIRDLM